MSPVSQIVPFHCIKAVYALKVQRTSNTHVRAARDVSVSIADVKGKMPGLHKQGVAVGRVSQRSM